MLIPPGVSYHQKSRADPCDHAVHPRFLRSFAARHRGRIARHVSGVLCAGRDLLRESNWLRMLRAIFAERASRSWKVPSRMSGPIRPSTWCWPPTRCQPARPASGRGFLDAAWQLTRPAGGRLLTVTFLGARGDLHELRMATLGRAHDDGEMLSELLADLESRGPTECRRFNSYVEADSSLGIAQFLRPWLSKEDDESSYVEAPLVAALESRYRVREGLYVLPIEHVSLSCERP